jgi:integrase
VRVMLAALVFCVVVTETHAAEYEYCVSDRQRNCWFDANYEARMAMEDMMFDVCDFSRGRQATLDYQKAAEFLAALRQRQGIAASALEVTLLTGLGTGEVIGARWSEIDLEKKVWVIPPDRLKDRRTRTEPHRVPLSPPVP